MLLEYLVMNEHQQDMFEKYVSMTEKWTKSIPITFLLGFYVANIVSRWWVQLNMVSWPDKLLILAVANINGDDEESRIIRRTLARYTNLLAALVWKEISVKIKKRFPTDKHLVGAGLMTDEEYALFNDSTSTYGRWFLPVSWMINVLAKCKTDGKISESVMQKMLDELYSYKTTAQMLTLYDWISIPLVYTQVVTIATYGYFLFCLFARQTLVATSKRRGADEADIFFPIFTTLEFLFYVGWLKVGEELRCPFGEGDEVRKMTLVQNRVQYPILHQCHLTYKLLIRTSIWNIHVSHMIVDELARQRPPLIKDRYWDDKFPLLPHTRASYQVRDQIPSWRLAKLQLEQDYMEVYDPSKEEKSTEMDGSSFFTRSFRRRRHSAGERQQKETIPLNNSTTNALP